MPSRISTIGLFIVAFSMDPLKYCVSSLFTLSSDAQTICPTSHATTKFGLCVVASRAKFWNKMGRISPRHPVKPCNATRPGRILQLSTRQLISYEFGHRARSVTWVCSVQGEPPSFVPVYRHDRESRLCERLPDDSRWKAAPHSGEARSRRCERTLGAAPSVARRPRVLQKGISQIWNRMVPQYVLPHEIIGFHGSSEGRARGAQP